MEEQLKAPDKDNKISGQAGPGAITALVLGIVGLFVLLVGPFAWIYGHRERKSIKNGQSSEAGMTLATVGWVLGIIETVLIILVPILLAIFIPIMIASRAAGK